MKCFPLLQIVAASITTLLAGQALTPIAHAQTAPPPAFHIRLDWQKAEASSGGLVIQGRITNTGSLPLIYTQVTPTLLNGAGHEIFQGSGYLTASPLLPGHSAEFRACEPSAPHFASLRMVFHEAGRPVVVEQPRVLAHR